MSLKKKFGSPQRYFWLLSLLFFLGCAAIARHALDERFGSADPSRYDRAIVASQSSPDFWHDVKPILDSRCVVCHACYDAPCQLKLSAYEGVTRGANDLKVYDTLRLLPAKPTRLFMDAHSNVDWRKKGFYPVLNERRPTPEANREGSVLYGSAGSEDAAMTGQTLRYFPMSALTFGLTGINSVPALKHSIASRRSTPSGGCLMACLHSKLGNTKPSSNGWRPCP